MTREPDRHRTSASTRVEAIASTRLPRCRCPCWRRLPGTLAPLKELPYWTTPNLRPSKKTDKYVDLGHGNARMAIHAEYLDVITVENLEKTTFDWPFRASRTWQGPPGMSSRVVCTPSHPNLIWTNCWRNFRFLNITKKLFSPCVSSRSPPSASC
jgi:hypothetical protein